MPRTHLLALVLGAAMASGACRIEERPDLPGEEQPGRTALVPNPLPAEDDPVRDSVAAVVAAVKAALAVGDVTRLAQLAAPGAVLIDQEEGVRWTRREASATLPRPLAAAGEGLAWAPTDDSFEVLADGTALYTLQFDASVSGESVPWSAVESWILVRDGQGWRVRYLHRSRGLGEDPGT